MGMSYADAKALGLAHLHPAHSGKSDRDILHERFGIGEEVAVSQAPADGMNKTERAFAETIEAAPGVAWWLNHSFKLRLAGRTWYTPDFLVFDTRLTFVEVKGFMRDDASVKLKVAAELYPQFRWLLVRREGRHGWDVREVTRRGIGTSPIHVPWIHGG